MADLRNEIHLCERCRTRTDLTYSRTRDEYLCDDCITDLVTEHYERLSALSSESHPPSEPASSPELPSSTASLAPSTPCDPLWQPIETAPRDEAILVSGGGILYPIVASWSGRDDESWRLDAEGNVRTELDHFPTHWMPLPSSPVTTDQPQTLPEPNGTENLKAILADQPYQNSGQTNGNHRRL